MNTSDEQTVVDVAIIGAGIGGAAAVTALRHVGITAHLYEGAAEIRTAGGGIALDGHSVDVLRPWGLADQFLEESILLDGLETRSMSGEVLAHFPLPGLTTMGVDVPGRTGTRDTYAILRADVQNLLLQQVPAEQIHLGKRVVSVADLGTHAEAVFADGTTVRARVLVGADGIQSLVRKQFDQSEAVRSDVVICRSLASADLLPDGLPNDRLRQYSGWISEEVGTHALTFPVRGGTHFVIDTQLHGGDQLLDLPDDIVPLERLLSTYAPDTDPYLINALRHAEGPTRQYPLYDQGELGTWSSEHITVLGDAAHAMRPTFGQGANQAIQDAEELARSLRDESDTAKALQAYESVRRPFTGAIQRAARAMRVDTAKWTKFVETD